MRQNLTCIEKYICIVKSRTSEAWVSLRVNCGFCIISALALIGLCANDISQCYTNVENYKDRKYDHAPNSDIYNESDIEH